MTNTPKLLSREDIEAIMERLEHLKTCGALRANSVAAPLLSASLSDIPVLLDHIEAQDELVEELLDFVKEQQRDQCEYECEKLDEGDHWDECDEMKALIASSRR